MPVTRRTPGAATFSTTVVNLRALDGRRAGPTLVKQQATSAVRASGNSVYKIGRSSYAKVSVLNLTIKERDAR